MPQKTSHSLQKHQSLLQPTCQSVNRIRTKKHEFLHLSVQKCFFVAGLDMVAYTTATGNIPASSLNPTTPSSVGLSTRILPGL
jgi:hypothetical protein